MLEKVWSLQVDMQLKVILLMWCWWSMRNKVNAGERKKSAQEVVNDVLFHMQTWNSALQKKISRVMENSQTKMESSSGGFLQN